MEDHEDEYFGTLSNIIAAYLSNRELPFMLFVPQDGNVHIFGDIGAEDEDIINKLPIKEFAQSISRELHRVKMNKILAH